MLRVALLLVVDVSSAEPSMLQSTDLIDARARHDFEKRTGAQFPGTALGGEGLECDGHPVYAAPPEEVVPQKMQRAAWIVSRLVKYGVNLEKNFLKNSLEIGPCASPIRLPGSVVLRQATVDWAPATAKESHCRGLQPTFVDDAQFLSTLHDGAFDLLLAAHVIEHLRDPLRALAHWSRVVRAGGHLVLFLPDACSPDMMDRARLAMPASHYAREYRSRQADSHEDEIAISLLRFARMFNSTSKVSALPSAFEGYRVLLSASECFRVLPNAAQCFWTSSEGVWKGLKSCARRPGRPTLVASAPP